MMEIEHVLGKGSTGTKTVTSTASTCDVVQDSLSDCSVETNFARLQDAVETLLVGVGEDIGREGLQDTPKRVAKAWLDVSHGYRQGVASVLGRALFHEQDVRQAGGGLVVVRDVEIASTSERDLLPFYGKCHIGYIPGQGVVLGLSKMARLAKLLGSRIQTQQDLTNDILRAFHEEVLPQGAAVIIAARHLSEGAKGSVRLTTAACGSFTDPRQPYIEDFLLTLGYGSSANLCSWEGADRGPDSIVTVMPASSAALPVRDSCHDEARPGSLAYTFRDVVLDDEYPGCDTFVHPSEIVRRRSSGHFAEPHQQSCRRHRCRWRPAMIQAVQAILAEIGADVNRGGFQSSAEQYVDYLLRATSGMFASAPPLPQELRPVHDMQMATLQLASLCEHHLLPFHGSAQICILAGPSTLSAPLTHLQAIMDVFARRLQVQERLTQQVAEEVQASTAAAGVLILCEAVHMCMVARGVESHASSTVTMAVRGCFAVDAKLRQQVLREFRCRSRTQKE